MRANQAVKNWCKMISKTAARKLIDEVAIEYEKCWKLLAEMKDTLLSGVSAERFLEFQPNLASALFRLDKMYLALCKERRQIIARKKTLTPEWVKGRLRATAAYQAAIKEVIALGRALGDSFAWVFYRNDRRSLERHFQHPQDLHTPPGIGGQGELEFIRRVKFVQGQMVLYHGITTFLRIGDISLIDLNTHKVIALGELKTRKTGPNEIAVGLFLTGPELDKKIPISASRDINTSPHDGLSPERQEDLSKQFKRMEESFKIQKADREIEYQDDTHAEALRSLAKRLEVSTEAFERAGDGLLFVGIGNPQWKSLSSCFLLSQQSASRLRISLNSRFPDLITQALRVIDREQAHTPTNANSLFIGHLSPHVMIGTVPLFWRAIPTDFLRKLFFRELSVHTIYNPAHLIKRLNAVGYDVEPVSDGRQHKVSKIIGESKIDIIGMEHFKSLVTNHLMHEDVVVELFSDMLREIEAGRIQPNSIITLRIEQH